MQNSPKPQSRIAEVLKDTERVTAAMNRGVQAAIEAHRQAGVPLVVWQDGRVVYLNPTTLEEVPPPEDEA